MKVYCILLGSYDPFENPSLISIYLSKERAYDEANVLNDGGIPLYCVEEVETK